MSQHHPHAPKLVEPLNIHVDVRRLDGPYEVLTSTDGAGWTTQHVVDRPDMPDAKRRDIAESTARLFAAGCRYAGAQVRMTSCGEPLLTV